MRKTGIAVVTLVALCGCSSTTQLTARVTNVERRIGQLEESARGRGRDTVALREQLQKTRAEVDEISRLATHLRGSGSLGALAEVRRVSVYFEHSSSVLAAESRDMLDGVIDELVTETNMQAFVTGFTDASGDAEFNDWLSDRRAEKVRQYLLAGLANGLDRVVAVGLGDRRPVADNETADGRRQNRRVEVSLLRSETAPPAQAATR